MKKLLIYKRYVKESHEGTNINDITNVIIALENQKAAVKETYDKRVTKG